jgi:CYTH domain-containing protein
LRNTATFINPSAPPGKSQRYSRPERERRFLLAGLPDIAVERTVCISDRYLVGTRLRLRKMVEMHGVSTNTYYKLTQKVPAPDGGPGLLSTTYLNVDEFSLLATLPATALRKTRYSVPPFGIDAYDAPLGSLILAEVEFDDDAAMSAFEPPAWIVAEVTFDSRFTGGRFSTMQAGELAGLLAEFGVRPAGT